MRSALITGVSGLALTDGERAFLREVRPAGFILFSRNCDSHEQIRALIGAVKEAIGASEFLVLIDQEGGRVQRLRPPLGRALPPASAYARLYAQDARAACGRAHLAARLLAEDLLSLGINTDCAPVLDLPVPGAHDVIGNRAYGTTCAQVADLGRAVCQGFMTGGVLPVIKHIPGHGRATSDSHLDLPVVTTPRDVLAATDFAPFKALAGMPAAMTAHVVFTAIDNDAPASTSEIVTRDVMRGEIGFDGLLMSDDLSMKALSGSFRARGEAVIRAGSDLALHCNGDISEMEAVAAGVPNLAGPALRRFESALRVLENHQPYDKVAALAGLEETLQFHARATESV